MSGGPWVMQPQPSANRPQFAGDDRTQVLAPVGRGNDCGRSWCDLKHLGFEHGHRGDLRHPVFMRPAEQTAVIPVTPAQPEADEGRFPWPVLTHAFAFTAGALISAWMWWF